MLAPSHPSERVPKLASFERRRRREEALLLVSKLRLLVTTYIYFFRDFLESRCTLLLHDTKKLAVQFVE